MPNRAAATPAEYLKALDPDRRAAIRAVRKVICDNLPAGYREAMAWGMITYAIPLSRYPDTYNKQPLCLAAIASQKTYCSLYLMGVYGSPAQLAILKQGFEDAGLRLDMGKSCIRFRKATDLPLATIGRLINELTVERYLEWYERNRPTKRARR